MKNWPSKMDLFLKFMLKNFEIQTFFGYNPLLGSYLAHIKKYFESFIVYYAKQPTFGEQNIPFLRVILYNLSCQVLYCFRVVLKIVSDLFLSFSKKFLQKV